MRFILIKQIKNYSFDGNWLGLKKQAGEMHHASESAAIESCQNMNDVSNKYHFSYQLT